MNRREMLKVVGAAAFGHYEIGFYEEDGSEQGLGRDPLSAKIEDCIEIARGVTPEQERDGAESAVDLIVRQINRDSNDLKFGEIIDILRKAIDRVDPEVSCRSHPSRCSLMCHSRLVAVLAQVQMQLGHVGEGLATIGRLRGTRTTSLSDLAPELARMRRVMGERSADDAVTTWFRLAEKSHPAGAFHGDEATLLLSAGMGTLRIPRNQSKLQWRSYLQGVLRGEGPERGRYEDRYRRLAQGGASPAMEEASLLGTLIYDHYLAGRPEEALAVSKRTRALIRPLWDGTRLLPRMTSHMILCHLYLILGISRTIAVLNGRKALRDEVEVRLSHLLRDMQGYGVDLSADGAWEAGAVLAKGRYRYRKSYPMADSDFTPLLIAPGNPFRMHGPSRPGSRRDDGRPPLQPIYNKNHDAVSHHLAVVQWLTGELETLGVGS